MCHDSNNNNDDVMMKTTFAQHATLLQLDGLKMQPQRLPRVTTVCDN